MLVLDPRPERLAEILSALRALGAAPGVLETPRAASAAGQVAAVIAVDDPCAQDPRLELVRGLAREGLTVVAHGAGAGAWPVARRCLPLLAGARHLLDAGTPGFAAELRARLAPILAVARARREEASQVEQAMARAGFVGRSRVILDAFHWVLRIAPLSDLPVLILGETGTGKELLARAIHRLDPKRSRGPFVPVNCAALTRTLAESELFGHRRGSFTGADRDRPGLVRAADGGVLFLDEIGELDPELQGKLLRVLQEGRVLGVGHDQEIAVDVRVVVATHRDLAELVRMERFREDLFHRLSVLPVRIPPLRERPEDLGPLVAHLLTKNRALHPVALRAGAGFLEALARLPLPGNVRELENLVRRAVAAKEDGAELDLADLPTETWRALAEAHDGGDPRAAQPSGPPLPGEGGALAPLLAILASHQWKLSGSLREVERLFLVAALERTRGNQTETARLLGLSARSVYTKIRKHRLQG